MRLREAIDRILGGAPMWQTPRDALECTIAMHFKMQGVGHVNLQLSRQPLENSEPCLAIVYDPKIE